MKSIFWRLVLLAVFTAGAIILFLPSTPLQKSLPAFWADSVPKIALGLDLQGGMHIVLEVDQEKGLETHVKRISDSVKEMLKENKVPYTYLRPTGIDSFTITYPAGSNKTVPQKINSLVSEEYPLFDKGKQTGNKLVFKLLDSEIERLNNWSTSQALEVIKNRLDPEGVTEPIIQRQGPREIVVQLPGIKDPQRAISRIEQTAMLEFRMLDSAGDITKALRGSVPFGSELIYQKKTDPETGEVDMIPFLVKKEILLTGDLISDARVAFDQYNESYVSITFDRQGGKIFERLTEQNINKRMAIILDGNLYSAPNINEKISGGRASISGGFSYDEAVDLAIVLRAGALPVPVKIIQNVTVGPSLGQDSINAGKNAIVLGAILVILFMIIYYRTSGIIAIWAVLLNLLMLMGSMAYFNATLTLPGIAGILLTIGMGVDANVLIFERIKEELRAGRTPRSAVDAGYDRAWWTIVDSQVTTLITAAVLFQFGSGPIKGFAVSLSLGIMINLFTALVGTKVIFDILNSRSKLGKINMMSTGGVSAIDFLSKRKVAVIISTILAVAGIIAAVAIPLGKARLGTDFTGGVAIQYRFEAPVLVEDARKILEAGGFGDADLQEFSGANKLLVKVKRSEGDLSAMSKAIGDAFANGLPENPYTVDSTTEIGPTVGKKLQSDAFWAVIISLFGIFFYIAWRFEFRFGIAAVVATFHDVLAVLAILFFMGSEINLMVITALLTIAGYSINDSVVVFDRIRENLKKQATTRSKAKQKETLIDLINRSVNEMLRRTIVTSGTTLLVLLALFVIGGEVIHEFSFTLIIGVLVGTYSSIFVASPLLLLWKGTSGRLIHENTPGGASAGKAIENNS